MSETLMNVLLSTLATGHQHAVVCTPDGFYFLIIVGPVWMH
jgi:hypothetical protein